MENGITSDLRDPAIAGVCVDEFIVIPGQSDRVFSTGYPLAGGKEVSKERIAKEFEFTGFCMKIQKES